MKGPRTLIVAVTIGVVIGSVLIWWVTVKDRLIAVESPPAAGKPVAELASKSETTPGASNAVKEGLGIADARPGASWQVGQAWTNSVGMKLVYIPPGEFVVQREADMAPILHKAAVPKKVTKGFLIEITEVTQAQWRAVMGSAPWSGKEDVVSGDDYPASYVSLEDAIAFSRKLSEKEGKTYRLPTRIEWEYACLAGAKTMFGFGGYDDRELLDEYAWYDKNAYKISEKYAHQVALKKPNPWGLYDMLGNVSEWCSDFAEAAGSKTHLFCGGSWLDEWVCCTPDSAGHDFASDKGRSDVGFRICVDVNGFAAPALADQSVGGTRTEGEGKDRGQTNGQNDRGLQRAGYSVDRCLICNAPRTEFAKQNDSDKKGFGLCNDCESKYSAWVRVLANTQRGLASDAGDERAGNEFKAVMSANFHRDDNDGRRGIGLSFLIGKFASTEWNTLTGGD